MSSRGLCEIVGSVVLAWFACADVAADDGLVIRSFDKSGRVVFDELETATVYRVEWANTLTGRWHACSPGVTGILARGVGQASATVGVGQAACYFRVIATVTNAPPLPPDGMALIPAGTNSGYDQEWGAYSLTVVAFFMDTTEVCKSKWDAVRAWAVDNGYDFDNGGAGKGDVHAVCSVSWYDCVKWCNARSEMEGRVPCYTVAGEVYRTGSFGHDYGDLVVACNFDASGYRLPTLTEWEYAARGGLSGRRFPWGDTISHAEANYNAWPGPWQPYDVNPIEGLHPAYCVFVPPFTNPVGAFAAGKNAYGLFDMAGNVYEWCWDPAPLEGSGGYSCRGYRGGSWGSYAENCRCGYVYLEWPDAAWYIVGFRAVCR